jgi:hypothetical protein
MQQATILSCVKHGIGDEITLVGTLVAALLQAGYRIRLITHHPLLYCHENILVEPWGLCNPVDVIPDIGDIRVCFENLGSVTLPPQFDVTPLVLEQSRRLGYSLIRNIGIFNAAQCDGGYEFAARITSSTGLDLATPPWPFLQRPCDGYHLLNPFGNDSIKKGMPPSLAWQVVEGILKSHGHLSFGLPLLTQMPLPPPTVSDHNNLKIEWFEHGDPELLERYLRAASVITAEGGGYHIAKAANIPALMVTSSQWFTQTRSALPPGPANILLFEEDSPNSTILLKGIRGWLDENSP